MRLQRFFEVIVEKNQEAVSGPLQAQDGSSHFGRTPGGVPAVRELLSTVA